MALNAGEGRGRWFTGDGGPTYGAAGSSMSSTDRDRAGPAQMSLSIDGKRQDELGRGDVQFIGRGVPHESKNTGGKPVDS